MSPSRDVILQRIRGALGDVLDDDPPPKYLYRTSDEAASATRVEDLADRLREYKATVHLVTLVELSSSIAETCQARGVKRLVIPAGIPTEWIPDSIEPWRDPGLSIAQLDASDGVLTSCTLAIAQTGTIVLDSGPGQGRRALTLVPDYHLCVVRAEQIVGLVPKAVALLRDRATSPLTWISGPSATTDIEFSRVEGVHGPRTMEVIIANT